MPTIICDECKERFNGKTYCNSCWWILKEEIEGLKVKIRRLENESNSKDGIIYDLQEKINARKETE